MAAKAKTESITGLQFLLKAKSQTAINELFLDVFKNRRKDISEEQISFANERFKELSPNDANQMIESVKYVIKEAIFNLLNTTERVEAFFPANFHAQLKTLIAKIVANHMPNWLTSSLFSQLSLPKLKSIDWRLDIKNASQSISQMSVPTILVQLVLHGQTPSNEKVVIFELNKETLKVMLNGLSKIRDQLNQLK